MVVAGWVKITLVDYYTEVHLETNKVRLRSGVSYALSSTTCIDADGGRAFWSPLPEDTCGKNKYSVLHTGTISKLYEEEQGRTLYTLNDDDITFALWKKEEHKGYKSMRTEYPKLFVIENANQNEFLRKETVAAANLDIFAYVNSKFL